MLEQRVGVNQKRGQTLESGKQLLASLISEDVEQIKKLVRKESLLCPFKYNSFSSSDDLQI